MTNIKSFSLSALIVLLSSAILVLLTDILNKLSANSGFLVFMLLLVAAFTCGAMFGAEMGTIIMALYIMANVLGYGYFINGLTGPESLSHPLGGYMMGFLLVAFMTGVIIPPGKDYSLLTLLITFLGTGSLLHFVGIPWLATQSNLEPMTVLSDYFLPLVIPHIVATLVILVSYKWINNLQIDKP